MGGSPTPRQERFAQVYIETGCATTAFRTAYKSKMTGNGLWVNAHRALNSTKVRLRIEQLQQQHAKRHEITVDRLTDMAVDAYDLAMTDAVKAPSAAVSAVTVLGKLHGLIVDRSKNEHTGPDGQPISPVINVSVGRDQS